MNFDEALAAHPLKPELQGDVGRVNDGLARDLLPADLGRVGISELALASYARRMYTTAEGLLSSDYFKYDYIDDVKEWMFKETVALLSKGKEWFLGPLRDLQPRSYQVLAESQLLGGFHARYDDKPPNPGNHVQCRRILLVQDRAIELVPYHTASPEETGIPGFKDDAYPEFLARSWWFRMAGYKLIREMPGNIGDWAGPLLSYPNCGTGVNDLVAWLGPDAKQRYMSVLKEMFGADTVTKVYETGRVALLCFLDTRVPMTNPVQAGDQLFIRRDRSDQVVYHTRECRFDQMRVMAPETLPECMDRYFEHVLLRRPGEFDFMPYSRPM
jgi:hypothetical protein